MKISGYSTEADGKASKLIRKMVPAEFEVFISVGGAWQVDERKRGGKIGKIVMEIDCCLNIDLIWEEVPAWVKALAKGLEEFKGSEVFITKGANIWRPRTFWECLQMASSPM